MAESTTSMSIAPNIIMMSSSWSSDTMSDGQGVVHLVVGEEALLLPHRDQPVELFQLGFFTHASGLLGDLDGSDSTASWHLR